MDNTISNKPIGLDIFSFLKLTYLSDEEKMKLRPSLEEALKEYLLIRLFDQLPDNFEEKNKDSLNNIKDFDDLLNFLKTNFPDLKEKTESIMQDFKKEYQNAGK